MTEPRAVLFDLDDTLCTYRRGGGELIEVAFERVGADPVFGVGEYHERYPEFVDETDDVRELRAECFAAICEDRGHNPDLGRAVAAAFAAERDHRDVDPLPGAVEAVEHLAADHRLGLVTNGSPEMQAQKLDGVGLADRFETVVHAGYDAPAKPAPGPFHAALDELGVAPERAVHVGNSLGSDVAGAHAAGVASAWLDDGSDVVEPTPDHRLGSLRALLDPPWR